MILHRRMQTVFKGVPGARPLHLDRDVVQKTPTCILTHRQAGQGPIDPGRRTHQEPGPRVQLPPGIQGYPPNHHPFWRTSSPSTSN